MDFDLLVLMIVGWSLKVGKKIDLQSELSGVLDLGWK